MAGVSAYIFSVISVVVIVLGLVDVLTNYESNRCEMTFMFEMPEYIRIPMKKAVNKEFPKYGLYVYGEGQYAQMLKDKKLTGIPVLFIPGNAGSYKQVRSLGSVAFRRVVDKKRRYHFNYFSVDFNEEMSAIYGGLLTQQTEYVHHCIQKILRMYKDVPNPPKSVMLVGHSIGGVIARALFTLPGFDPSTVHTIITQATPHRAPVASLDYKITEFYRKVNNYWRNHAETTLKNIIIVSTGGGYRDVQVRNGLTSLQGVIEDHHAISTSTMSTPKAWVSTDHLCAVWCKQMVLATVRATFDIVDPSTLQFTDSVETRMSAFRHHFLHHNGPVGNRPDWPTQLSLTGTEWTLIRPELVWTLTEKKTSAQRVYAIPVGELKVDNVAVISNIEVDDWICVCKVEKGQKKCSTCKNLSPRSEMIPPVASKRKAIHINLEDDDLQDMTHVVVVVPESKSQVELAVQAYMSNHRELSSTLPGLVDIMLSYPESVMKGALVLELKPNSIFYKLKLMGLGNVVKAYSASLVAKNCTKKSNDIGESAGSVLAFHVPWSNENTYHFAKYGGSSNLSLKLQNAPPDSYTDTVGMYMYLDPTCRYTLKIGASFTEMLGQFMRFYGTLLPAFCVGVLLITLRYQLLTLAAEGTCPSVLDSIWQTQPWKVVPFALILQAVLQVDAVQRYTRQIPMLPPVDMASLNSQGIWFRGAHLVMYLLSLGIVTFHATMVNLLLQLLSRALGLVFGWLPSIVSRLAKTLAVCMCVLSVGVAAVVCGAAGVFICYVVCLIQVLRLCYLTSKGQEAQARSKFNFFFLVFLLWMWLLILSMPSLIVWTKNLEIESFKKLVWDDMIRQILLLRGDPSKLTGVICTVVFTSLLLCNTPFSGRSAYKTVGVFIHVMTVLMLVYAVETVYRISYFAAVILVAIAAPQIIQEIRKKLAPRPKTE